MSGIIPVDKPSGPTSHDVVAIARRALGIRRVGHTGTLDPFATGLLLICLGPATRLSEYLTALPKTYLATLRMGEATDTDDLEGEVLQSTGAWRSITSEAVERALKLQVGDLQQVPPRYSAKKVAGERSYSVARRGGDVERRPVPVTIPRITMTHFDPPDVVFEVDCSGGTYIRAIARDVGETLGVGAHLLALRRTRIGDFHVEGAPTPEELADPDIVARALLSPLDAVRHLDRVTIGSTEKALIAHGGNVPLPEGLAGPGPIVVADEEGNLVAVGERRGDTFQPRKVFV